MLVFLSKPNYSGCWGNTCKRWTILMFEEDEDWDEDFEDEDDE